MLWIAIHLPDLPLQVFCRADPGHTPLVVCAPAKRRVVLSANAAALECGIAPGCSLSSARALASGLVVRERSATAEAALLSELASWALQFSPQVSLDPPCGVLLDVTGSLRLFGGIEALLERIRQGTKALGLHAIASCAPTPLAACWLARSAHPGCTTLAQLPEALAPLPLDCIFGETTHPKFFADIGCRTLGDCFGLPRDALAQRGRQGFLRQLDQALGRLPDPRLAWQPPPCFHARIELPCPMERADFLLLGAQRMLNALSGTLRAHQRLIEHFTLGFEHEELPPSLLEIHLGSACHDEARFILLAQEHLQARALPAPALAITLEAAHWIEMGAAPANPVRSSKRPSPSARRADCPAGRAAG
jgi:protein ImuB